MDSSEFKTTIRSSILILLFEGIGTFFLTLLFICNSNVSTEWTSEKIYPVEYLAVIDFVLLFNDIIFVFHPISFESVL
jgi:hypothetical protein